MGGCGCGFVSMDFRSPSEQLQGWDPMLWSRNIRIGIAGGGFLSPRDSESSFPANSAPQPLMTGPSPDAQDGLAVPTLLTCSPSH